MEKTDAYKILGLEPGTSDRQCKHKYVALKERTEKLLANCEGGQEQSLMRRQIARLEEAYAALELEKVDITSAAPADPNSEASQEKKADQPRAPLPQSPHPSANRRKAGFSFTGAKRAILEALTPIRLEPEEDEPPIHKPIVNNLKSDWKESKGPSAAPVSRKKLIIAGIRLAAAIIVLAIGAGLWKAFIHNPAIRQKEYAQVERAIASLSDNASDAQIQNMTNRVRSYAKEAKKPFAKDAIDSLNSRVNEIREIREEKAAIVREDRKQHISVLNKDLKDLKGKQKWLRDVVSEAEATGRTIRSMMRSETRKERAPYLVELNDSFDNFRRWVGRFDREHPLHPSVRDGEKYINRGLLKQADLAIAKGKRATPALEEQVALQRMALHGDRILKWVKKEANQKAIPWLKQDDPAVIESGIQTLKARLARLDKRPATSDSIKRLNDLAILASKDDPDYKRWIEKALPDLTVKSSPEGAQVFDNAGKLLGNTPFTIKNLPEGEHTFGVALKKHDFVAVKFLSELNAQNQSQAVELTRLIEPDIGEPYFAALPGGVEMIMAFIEKGSFRMGSPEREASRDTDEAIREITLDRWFWLGITEVTQSQWESLMGDDWRKDVITRDGNRILNVFGPNKPVHSITWEDAIEFCKRLTEHERNANRISKNFEFRLPTEEQWEYACRAGTTTPFHFGETLTSSMANFNGVFPYNSSLKTALSNGPMDVGSFEANAFGVYDMHGNVWEWCIERTLESDNGSRPTNIWELFSSEKKEHAVRGGSWYSSGAYCRSAKRRPYAISYKENTLGLRVLLYPIGGASVLEKLRQNAVDDQK